MDALVRLQPAAEQHNKIPRRKAQRGAQRRIGRTGGEQGGVDAVVQDIGPLAVQRACAQVIVTDEFAQCQNPAVDLIHCVAAGQAAVAAEHPADRAALGQGAALGHNQIRRGQFQRKRKLYLLVPGVIRRGNAKATLNENQRPVPPRALGPGDVKHLGVAKIAGLGHGLRVRDAGAKQVQLTAALIFAQQPGDQCFHRAALHRRHRQFRRGHQQHARAARFGGRQAQQRHGERLLSARFRPSWPQSTGRARLRCGKMPVKPLFSAGTRCTGTVTGNARPVCQWRRGWRRTRRRNPARRRPRSGPAQPGRRECFPTA